MSRASKAICLCHLRVSPDFTYVIPLGVLKRAREETEVGLTNFENDISLLCARVHRNDIFRQCYIQKCWAVFARILSVNVCTFTHMELYVNWMQRFIAQVKFAFKIRNKPTLHCNAACHNNIRFRFLRFKYRSGA